VQAAAIYSDSVLHCERKLNSFILILNFNSP
jgi:hypothetical protein